MCAWTSATTPPCLSKMTCEVSSCFPSFFLSLQDGGRWGGFLTDLPTRAWPQYPGILLTLSLCTQAVSGAAASHPRGAKSNKRQGGSGRSEAARHKGSCENKTDPLGGSGKHTHKKMGGETEPGQNNICGNVQLPVLAVCCANHSSVPRGGVGEHILTSS